MYIHFPLLNSLSHLHAHTILQEPLFFFRVIYDLSFFFLVIIIIIQNLIFGVIIDTFADLRAEKNRKEEMLKNTCFICGKNIVFLNSIC